MRLQIWDSLVSSKKTANSDLYNRQFIIVDKQVKVHSDEDKM